MKKIFTIFSIFLLVVGLYCPTLAEVSSLSAPAGNKVTKATSSATETTPIYDIQYVETPASNDSSLLVGQTVTVSGIVTGYVKASSYSKYYVQEETGSWHGIYVYDNKSGATLSVGDQVNVTGSIAEYFGLTELMATSVEVTSSGNTLPEPVKITSALTEAEEGILVTLENAVLTTDTSSDTKKYLLATVNGVDYKIFGDLFKQVSFEEGGTYNITGLVTYTFNYFRICPRSADDVIAATSSDEPSIYDIQYVADPSVKDSSSYVGQEVTVSGIVTGYLQGSSYNKYYVQEQTGLWHGIYVYDNKSGTTLSVGDQVSVTGSIAEYYGLTELMATSVEVISSGNTLPEPVKITGAITEAEEGILVTLENAVLTTDVSSDTKKYLLATVNGVEYKIFGDLFKQVSFEEGGKYNITGLVTYTYNYFRICPRSADDVVAATSSDEPSIYDIQYVADPSVKDSSSYVGQEVTVSGIVTGYLKASSYSKYYVQEETGSWHGIYVYDNKSGATLSVGDQVSVTGSIAEYYGLTELMATSVEIISSGNTLPEPVKITGALTEAEEGILVTLENAVLTTDVSSDSKKYLLATVNGVDYKIFGDLFKQVSFEEGSTYNITGLVTYTFNYFRICPRSADDVVVATPNVSNLIEFEMDSLAYQVIVDYSNNNGLNGAKYPETTDDYFGASSYYKNFDTQYDGSFDNEKFSSWEEAVKNSIANIVLPARFPSAVESDSIEVSFTYYNGSKSGTDAFIFVYNNGTFAPVNNRAEIYSVAVAGQIDKTLVIDKAAKTVTLQVESGTNVAALVPTISYSYGATISPASGVAQNFSEPVAYTVTSEKGVSAIWTVTVTVMSNATTPIYDIQYVANPAANDSSSFVGETVIAQGIVTGFAQFSSYNKYYIQDEASFWHGIYVYDNKTSTILDMGDKVKVRGAVSEYYGLTELMASSVEVVSSRNTLPDPIVVDELSEQTEGILVTIEGVTLETDVDAEDYASALYLIAKKDGKEYKIYNEFFKDFTPEAGKKYNVTGPVTFVRSHFRISPRFADDFAVATGVNEYFQNKNLSVYPNPAANILTVEGSDAIEVTIRNIVGQTVMVSPLSNNKVDVSTLEKGIYFIQAGKTFARFVKL